VPSLRRTIVVGSVVVAAMLGYLVFSLITTFRYWPWTVTTVHDGMAFGFEVGESKAQTLAAVVELQEAGSALRLSIPEKGLAVRDTYDGYPARMDDLSRVSPHDNWRLGLSACNCWLLLHFSDDHLSVITHKRYRGPTE